MHDLITIVPVRLGSRRVKLKSLRMLDGKPLVGYILETLKRSRFHRNVFINSDSEIYGSVARQYGVGFYKRAAHLATSESLIDDYLYDFMRKHDSRYLAVVNPTSPFITAEHLDDAWAYYRDGGYDTLLSCENIQTHCFYDDKPLNFSITEKHPRSQDLTPIQALNFAITIFDREKYIENYEENGCGVYTGKLALFPTSGYGNIDVDYEEDFALAEFVAEFLRSGKQREPVYSELASDLIDIDVSN